MSLTGNLEDLPLLDILQIVSFSKKTGFLTIQTAQGSSAIVFREGFVVSAFAWDSPPVAAEGPRPPAAEIQRRVRQQIDGALRQLIRLREGEFNFSLTEEPPARVDGRDVAGEMLEHGINPQELLLGLARGMDEDRRDSAAALEASFADAPADLAPVAEPRVAEPEPEPELETLAAEDLEPAPEEPTAAAAPAAAVAAVAAGAAEAPAEPAAAAARGARAIVLVDDEDDVRAMLAEHFKAGGYGVLEAEDPDSALKRANELAKAGIEFLLVTDLGMPTSGGSSFHGGFEVVKRLWKANLKPPVLMMTDTFNGAVQARARQMGIGSIVFKPGLSKLDPQQFAADLRAFARKLLTDVLPKLAPVEPAVPGARTAKPAAGGGEAKETAPPAVPAASAPPPATPAEISQQLEALQARLDELRQGGEASQIAALVMKAARDFFERGVLFVVKGEELRGLGGFGRAPRGESVTLAAREVTIPLAEPSVFLDVVTTGRPFVGELPAGRWSQHLLAKVGRFRSSAAAIIPLQTNREAVAVLYGDNPESGRVPARLEPLTIFITQAGIALENAFLQRKVSALEARD